VLHVPYAQFMHDSIAGHGFSILGITPRHTETLTTLPFPMIGGKEHRDPFDRLLIAQAMTEGMNIISGDAVLTAYGIPVVW